MEKLYDRSNSQLVAVCMFCTATQTVEFYKITRNMRIDRTDKRVIIILIFIILVSLVTTCITSCRQHTSTNEFPMNLSEVVETGYSNTVDGDSMYWAIYEEWYNDCTRHLLYMDKKTFDSLEKAVDEYNKLPLGERVSYKHGFKLIQDSEGLHICSIR